MSRTVTCLMLASLISLSVSAVAAPIDDLSGVLRGRSGASSEDRRSEVKDPTGLFRIGCKGDTLEANVSITGISGNMEGDTAAMSVKYSGKYYRQGWDVPCQKVSSNLGGLEERTVTGTYSFRVTGKAFQKPTIVWGQGSGYGEITDPNHDSNIFAVRAVQNAIGTAF